MFSLAYSRDASCYNLGLSNCLLVNINIILLSIPFSTDHTIKEFVIKILCRTKRSKSIKSAGYYTVFSAFTDTIGKPLNYPSFLPYNKIVATYILPFLNL